MWLVFQDGDDSVKVMRSDADVIGEGRHFDLQLGDVTSAVSVGLRWMILQDCFSLLLKIALIQVSQCHPAVEDVMHLDKTVSTQLIQFTYHN